MAMLGRGTGTSSVLGAQAARPAVMGRVHCGGTVQASWALRIGHSSHLVRIDRRPAPALAPAPVPGPQVEVHVRWVVLTLAHSTQAGLLLAARGGSQTTVLTGLVVLHPCLDRRRTSLATMESSLFPRYTRHTHAWLGMLYRAVLAGLARHRLPWSVTSGMRMATAHLTRHTNRNCHRKHPPSSSRLQPPRGTRTPPLTASWGG